jgi:hypothetical protein
MIRNGTGAETERFVTRALQEKAKEQREKEKEKRA